MAVVDVKVDAPLEALLLLCVTVPALALRLLLDVRFFEAYHVTHETTDLLLTVVAPALGYAAVRGAFAVVSGVSRELSLPPPLRAMMMATPALAVVMGIVLAENVQNSAAKLARRYMDLDDVQSWWLLNKRDLMRIGHDIVRIAVVLFIWQAILAAAYAVTVLPLRYLLGSLQSAFFGAPPEEAPEQIEGEKEEAPEPEPEQDDAPAEPRVPQEEENKAVVSPGLIPSPTAELKES
eukprot:CAMPEP_0118879508 /NCGR_PEP_ID=MMETSP1163-20130328/19291_1 /TAXON_ID=124430 /ORGANISM="Phaeomonas parva, Strain CCMP2877" /LENGTH=235 /DNA_ID=CAMNT_0006815681 /DNA_START=102 /DNA_END=809 /DNA_ORIENTATION=-